MIGLIRGIVVFTLSCLFFTSFRCTTQQVTGVGTGSETVIGKLVEEDGTPSGNAIVMLHPYNYDPVLNSKSVDFGVDTTDIEGNYTITLTSPGANRYTLQAKNQSLHTRTIVHDIVISTSGESTFVDPVSLQRTGSIEITLSENATAQNGYVFIPGTNYHSYVENGYAIIDSVPAVIIQQLYYKPNLQSEPRSLSEHIKVEPEITTTITSSGSAYSRRIYLNTSPSGADIADRVTDFPILIRLRESNFNFSQAKVDGSDLHFSRATETTLPHEIERWDVVNQEAEIWVKVDTIHGNNRMQFINMSWGDTSTTYYSKGSEVFDTAAGYRGVWHLGDDETTITDATTNRHNGTKQGNQTRTAGIIGFSHSFDGSEDYTDLGNVCNPDTFSLTVSAWIRATGSNKIQTIISKSTGGLPHKFYGWLLQLNENGALQIYIATDSTQSWGGSGSFVLTSNKWIADSAWHHVAAVIDRSNSANCRVYIDGSDDSSLPTGGDIRNIGSVVNTLPLRFGSDAHGNYQWEGLLDECSISFRAHSPDYIKLCFMNQRNDDALTVFK